MQRDTSTMASLIFTEDRFVSLTKVSEVLTTALLRVREIVAASDLTQDGLVITCDRYRACFEVLFGDKETVLTLCICDLPGRDATAREARLSHLAFLMFPLALNLPCTCLVWPGGDIRIPRQRFVDGLAESFVPLSHTAHLPPTATKQAPPCEAPQDDLALRDAIRRTTRTPEPPHDTRAEPPNLLERIGHFTAPVFNRLQ